MSISRKCFFKSEWLSQPEFKCWLLEKPGDSHSAICKMCKKTIDISNMGVCALRSHTKSVKHLKFFQAYNSTRPVQSFFKSSTTTSEKSEEEPSSTVNISSSSVTNEVAAPSVSKVNLPSKGETVTLSLREKCVLSETGLKSEILWVLNVATKHMSFNSCKGISNLFATMFPDSEVAKSFSCRPSKCSYLLCFGIAQYFKDKLIQCVSKCEVFSLCFDGSVNKFIQKDQVDIVVRFWDDEAKMVKSRYIGSQFLGHAKAPDLVEALQEASNDLDSRNLLQIGMDGPNVNMKVLKDIITHRETMYPEYPMLIDVGSCSIHTLHRAFQVGSEQSGWGLDCLLRALWKIFKDSPARRSDYQAIDDTGLMPLKFCATRWIEDVAVSERAISIWPSIVKFVDSYKDKPRSTVASKSFQTVKEASKDNFVTAKLNFFAFVGKLMQPYLKCYQTDEPMIPFQANDVLTLLYNIMSLFVKKDVVDKCNTDFGLCSIDLGEKENLQACDKIETGFAAREILSKLLQVKKVTAKEVSMFKVDCQKFLKALVKKIIDKNPMKYPVVRLSRCLQPKFMIANKAKTIELVTKLLQDLQKRKLMLSAHCDNALSELKLLLSDCQEEDFNRFERSKDRLDCFFYNLIGTKIQYCHLWKVIKLILTLSHGQASVERGFSINKEVIVENLKEQSLVALRLVCDELQNCDIHELVITKELLSYARSARMKYQHYLDGQKKKNSDEGKSKKRSAKVEELKSLKKRKFDLESAIQTMSKEADELAQKAENRKDFTLLAKSNSFRVKGVQMAIDLEKLTDKITKLVKES